MLLVFAALVILIMAWLFPYAYDDAFISFRVTENLIKTGFPFFNSGQQVYTNTSLVYPVWNGFWCLLFGQDWINKISLLNGLLQVFVLVRLATLFHSRSTEPKVWLLSILAVLPLFFSTTQLVTGNSGLETSLYQVAIAFSILPGSFKILGWFAGFIRPEGFLLGAVHLVAKFWAGQPWVRYLFWGILVASTWLALSWFWYGTFIPQSILAKANYDLHRLDQIQNGYRYLFLQGYGFYALLIGSAWVRFPNLRAEFFPMLLWLIFYTLFFSVLASWWAWYVPPILVPVMYMAGRSTMEWYGQLRRVPTSGFFKIQYWIGFFLVFSAWEGYSSIRRKAQDSGAFQIRNLSSQKIGTWLESHIPANQTVLLEPLGLIGYYSPSVKLLDYPGLSRPEMSEFLRSLPWKIPIQLTDPKTDSAVLSRFQPDWLLLFPYEVSAFQQIIGFTNQYQKVDSLPYYPKSDRFRQAVFFKRINRKTL